MGREGWEAAVREGVALWLRDPFLLGTGGQGIQSMDSGAKCLGSNPWHYCFLPVHT